MLDEENNNINKTEVIKISRIQELGISERDHLWGFRTDLTLRTKERKDQHNQRMMGKHQMEITSV